MQPKGNNSELIYYDDDGRQFVPVDNIRYFPTLEESPDMVETSTLDDSLNVTIGIKTNNWLRLHGKKMHRAKTLRHYYENKYGLDNIRRWLLLLH